jgi:Protein-L-isoaspartate(D-aspartate) O-methyltransferase (PCMT)
MVMQQDEKAALAEKGKAGLVHQAVGLAYQRLIRSWLPGRPLVYAGIPVSYDRKWGDAVVPPGWRPDVGYETGYTDEPGYEVALISALNESVRPGDRVVVVGGGVGVTAVIAANLAGSSGTVVCFEGSKQYVRHIQETASRNRVSNIVVKHAIVSKPIAVYGKASDFGEVVSPDQLPECDVLELDCEGAEVDILRNMAIRPRVIIVETHGAYGAPTSLVDSTLKELGYAVRNLGLAEPRIEDVCTEKDIQVLFATKSE